MNPTNVEQALAQAKALGVERLDAQLLLARALSCSRSWLLAHGEAMLNEAQARQYGDDLQRRGDAVPLAYLLGTKEFRGLNLHINPAVLVPRPETEMLVDWALELLEGELLQSSQKFVVDLGTGSGAIALAIKKDHPEANVCATDASAAALAVAVANAERLRHPIAFLAGPWWQAVGNRRFHLAVSNPPYVASGDPHLFALRHEPAMALTAGTDGLDAIRLIVSGARNRLQPGGWLLIEHGHDQAPAVSQLLRAEGFLGANTRRDLAGLPRCSGAHL
ncbi:MAG: peptide chain release factor N(5)-glutamine methyltransferase [Rhizobacter sp.]|nr:peptide chain release factor N(5)-glutamine methyltransferase [Rhizobacter sp.]